jgi:hypothetical protein
MACTRSKIANEIWNNRRQAIRVRQAEAILYRSESSEADPLALGSLAKTVRNSRPTKELF